MRWHAPALAYEVRASYTLSEMRDEGILPVMPNEDISLKVAAFFLLRKMSDVLSRNCSVASFIERKWHGFVRKVGGTDFIVRKRNKLLIKNGPR